MTLIGRKNKEFEKSVLTFVESSPGQINDIILPILNQTETYEQLRFLSFLSRNWLIIEKQCPKLNLRPNKQLIKNYSE